MLAATCGRWGPQGCCACPGSGALTAVGCSPLVHEVLADGCAVLLAISVHLLHQRNAESGCCLLQLLHNTCIKAHRRPA